MGKYKVKTVLSYTDEYDSLDEARRAMLRAYHNYVLTGDPDEVADATIGDDSITVNFNFDSHRAEWTIEEG